MPLAPQPTTPLPRSAARWAWIVVLLYGVVLAVLFVPVVLILMARANATLADYLSTARSVYESWMSWVPVILALAVSQAAMLTVPVRVASRRPVTRRRILWPIVMSGLMFAVLLSGAAAALYETFNETSSWASVAVILVSSWAGWAVMFYRWSAARAPSEVVARQCNLLLKGSILELLIAVPCHVWVRQRDDCCAGIGTAWGIAMGISVMLFSFGPGVFFLYVDRWRRLQPRSGAGGPDSDAAK